MGYLYEACDQTSDLCRQQLLRREAFLDPSDSYFLFAGLVDFYTHLSYMHIFVAFY
jgi:hypothetical protein